MFDKLQRLKVEGYEPSVILDIGAHHGNWTKQMKEIYPTSKYYLFEAIDYPQLDQFDHDKSITVYKNVLLNDKVEEIDWYEEKNTGDSFFKEKTKHFSSTVPIKKSTIELNTILSRDGILTNQKNVLVKIDCQGAEIPILKGGTLLFNVTDFIILEIPLFGQYNEGVPNFTEHIKYMDSIGFVPYNVIDNHRINDFNMQVDVIFVNTKCDVYSLFQAKPHIYSTILTNFNRTHVINYVKQKKAINSNYRVLDIGGSAEYTSWSYPITDYIADINPPQNPSGDIKYFKLNVNFETEWSGLFDHVEKYGKFDFCICSHIIEDISLPQVLLENLKKIAKEGFIAIPSKYRELSKIEGKYLGYIHHRWIYSFKNGELIGYPKVNFIDHETSLINIGNSDDRLLDLSFFWKNDIPFSIINDNYLGPNVSSVKTYYNNLISDDVDLIKSQNWYNINMITTPGTTIVGGLILVHIPIENLVRSLEFMDERGFVPFDIVQNSPSKYVGTLEFRFVFINKEHQYNNDVQKLLL